MVPSSEEILTLPYSSHSYEVYIPKDFIPHAALLGQACAHCPKFPTAASRRSLTRIQVSVWPTALSGRLQIAGLVSHYLTNNLICRRLLFRREVSCESPRFNNCLDVEPLHYAVLAAVSGCYSPPKGRLPTCYSPVRHSTRSPKGTFAFDLHV